MAKAKLDAPTLATIVIGGVLMAGGAIYIARLGATAEHDLPAFFLQLRWIMLAAAALALVVAALLARRLDELAAKTEAQRKYPPEGVDAPPSGLADDCSGEPALMVAARLRGYSLMALCLGIATGLTGLLCAFSV